MEDWAQRITTEKGLREELSPELERIVQATHTQSEAAYKLLKYMCTLGSETQDRILHFQVNLTPPSSSSPAYPHYLQLLNNLCVSNPSAQTLIWPIAQQLPITNERQFHLYITLLTTLTAGQPDRGDWFTDNSEGIALFSYILTKLEVVTDETFEWIYILLHKIVPGRVEKMIKEAKSHGQDVVFLNYLDALMAKNWEMSTFSSFILHEADLSALISLLFTLPDIHQSAFQLTLSILEISVRPGLLTPSIQELYLNTGFLQHCYTLLPLQTPLKSIFIQLLCNTLENYPPAADLAFENLYLLLSCTRIDAENIGMREWVVLMVRFLVEMKPETREKIGELEVKGGGGKVELDPRTLRPKYRHVS